MLTTQQIVDLITSTHGNEQMRGQLAYYLRQETQQGMHRTDAPGGQSTRHVQFLQDVLDALPPRGEQTTRSKHIHPALSPAPFYRKSGPLETSEIAWLQLLPQDPAAVTFDDAVTLARLHDTVPAAQHPLDARLVRAHWLPVKTIHDRHEAEADLANAQQSLRSIPASTLGALADAFARELPELNDDATALTVAAKHLRDAVAQREAEQYRQVTQAEQTITAITDAVTHREALTR